MSNPFSETWYGYADSNYFSGDSTPAVPLLLDNLAATYGAWSVARKLRTGYSGALSRVREAVSNTELDIPAVNGELDEAVLQAHAGSHNSALRSEDVTHFNWLRGGFDSLTANATIAPDGAMTADLLTENTDNSNHAFYQQVAGLVPLNAPVTVSLYAKAGTRTKIRVVVADSSATPLGAAIFDLSNGTIVSATSDLPSPAVITAVGNGWYRCSVAATSNDIVVWPMYYLVNDANQFAYTGTNATLYVWGMQVNAGTVPQTYRKTDGTPLYGHAYYTKIYNQDANGSTLDFAQATTTIQPIAVEYGQIVKENGKPAAKFVAASARRMAVPSSTALFKFLHGAKASVAYVCKFNNTALQKTILSSVASSIAQVGVTSQASASEECWWSVGNGSATIVNRTQGAFGLAQLVSSVISDPANATVGDRIDQWVNNAQQITTNVSSGSVSSSNAASNFTVGSYGSGGQFHDGTIQELIIWPTDETASRTIWEADMADFYGVTLA